MMRGKRIGGIFNAAGIKKLNNGENGSGLIEVMF